MSFIRPELRAAAWRARELLAGAALCLLGLWAAIASGGILAVLGWVGSVLGLLIALGGLQRLRFRRAGEGPGLVQVDEAQIAYFGPLTGGVVATDLLQEIVLDPTGRPLHWVLRQEGAPPLYIPVTAAGAEQLFDVFASLPGMETEAMLRRLDAPGSRPETVWRRPALRLG